jgi:heme/copper-type cytochrome/quinol oxidase subunit 2
MGLAVPGHRVYSSARHLAAIAGGATIDPPSPGHAIALVVSVGVLLTVQTLLIRRTLATRKRVGDEPPGESPARELMWALLPALLLLALLLYSLHYARFI